LATTRLFSSYVPEAVMGLPTIRTSKKEQRAVTPRTAGR
jgi:hypothetical protein